MGIGDSKCQKELKLEKMAIELFLKDRPKHKYLVDDDLNKNYDEFKGFFPTMERLNKYAQRLPSQHMKAGKRRRTRRNRVIKR